MLRSRENQNNKGGVQGGVANIGPLIALIVHAHVLFFVFLALFLFQALHDWL